MCPKRQRFDPKDNDRPIETYSGYLGYYYDGSYFLEPALQPLLEFPWDEYRDFEGAPNQSSVRTIEFLVRAKRRRVAFQRDMIDLASFLELFPAVKAEYDGEMLGFWQRPRYSLEEITDGAASCRQALDRDFEAIKQPSIAS